MKKATIATVKSFIRKNADNALINVKSSFDGMTDSVESLNGGFRPLQKNERQGVFTTDHNSNPSLGFNGVWFVGGSRDYVQSYENDNMQGFEVSNSCGSWIVAIRKAA